ncbi:DUF4493 domain-containing protein [Bacteroides gallinarum]|uniref:DUF4493 domain-containing protein n=1 Tax=Bacteroides gallinarum TaxID=376806 RepID=UPI00037745A5|nr:DUF4493 domain-containing protein [Bacteroides gallinarum]
MGKIYTTILTLFTVISITLSGCERDDGQISNRGKINLKLTADASVERTVTRVAAGEAALPDTDDFSVAVLQNNNVQLSWDKYADFTDGTELPAGNYTLKAAYGNIETQGFDAPYYEGTEDFSIKKNESTDVSVTCYLANVKITTEYTDLFKEYFTDYTVNIRPAGSPDISFDKDETRAAYVKPGKITVYLSGSKQQGSKVTFEAATIDNAKARQHYRLKFDVKAGGTELHISFTDETERVPVTIDISDEALNTRAPFFTPTGFEPGVTRELIEWTEPESTLSALLTARGGISKCVLITHSPSLLNKGWPAEIDLAEPDPSILATLQNLGLALKGLSANIDKMAVVDFTKALANLSYSETEAENTFTLIATDKLGKVNEEPLILRIKSLSNGFDVAQPMNAGRGSTSVLLTVTLKGDISRVEYRYQAYGYWQSLTPTNVKSDEYTHQVTLAFKDGLQEPQQLKVIAGDKEKTVTVEIGESSCSLSAPEGNVWAKSATIYLTGDTDGTTEFLKTVKDITVQCRKETGDWFSPVQEKVKNTIEITGLEPDTRYTFKATIGGTNTITVNNEVTLETEEALQIPNSGFEEWYTDSDTRWSAGTFGNFTHYFYYPYSKDATDIWWNTNNKYSQAWTVAPVQTTTCPAVIYVKDAKSGNKAAEIHTAGSGGEYSSTPSSMYPQSARAGRLFIGTYNWNDKKETVTTGHAFASRPREMKFWYKYTPYQADNFKVEIEIRSNGKVIASGSYIPDATSTADTEYREGSITLDYNGHMEKATGIYVDILSTTKTSFTSDDLQKAGTIDLTDCATGWTTHLGSRLKIDDLELIYE